MPSWGSERVHIRQVLVEEQEEFYRPSGKTGGPKPGRRIPRQACGGPREREILGFHILAPHGDDLLHEALSSPVPLAQKTSDATLPELSRVEMENFLLTAKIVEQRSLSVGITGIRAS